MSICEKRTTTFVYIHNKMSLRGPSGFPEVTMKQRIYDSENESDLHVSNLGYSHIHYCARHSCHVLASQM